jgi:hypothetical protein
MLNLAPQANADHSKENAMPERVSSFAPSLPCVFLVLVATGAVDFISPVRAESACIEQPSQRAAEGTHWSARYDRAKGRKCWFLLDADGRDIAASPAQPSSAPTPSPVDALSSQIASLLGSLTAAAENGMPQVSAPSGDAAQAPPRPPHKPRGNGANASRADNGVRGEQKGAGEARGAVKRVSAPLTESEREELFEEFLRWQEIQQTIGASSQSSSSR